MDILAEGSPASRQVDCDSGTEVSDVEETVTTGSSTLQYDPVTDRYTYVWKTDKAWAKKSGQFVLTLSDGTTHTFDVGFKK